MRILTAASLFCIALFIGPAGAQGMRDIQGLPNTPQANLASRIISALSTGDGETFAGLLQEYGTADFIDSRNHNDDRTLARKLHFRAQGLDVWGRRVFGQEGKELNVLAKERLSGAWRQITLVFSDEKISGFGVAYSMPPEPGKNDAISKKDAKKQIASYLQRAEQVGLFSGAVLIAQGDDILLNAAYGNASTRYAVPNTLSTRFNLASANKMFTASIILRMVEKGVLALDTTVSDILGEDWISPETGSKITIHHLLTHTSGLGTYFTEEFLQTSPLLYRDVSDYKALIRQQKLAFEPGADWLYSNAGYILLGAIIEKVSGASYDDQLDSEIFPAAGMTSTGCFAKDSPVRNIATNLYIDFSEDSPVWREETLWGTVRGGPAGGCYSTTEDLWRFAKAMMNDALFSREARDLAWTDYTPENAREEYGLGFFLWGGPFGQYIGHSGGFFGPNAEVRIDPDHGWIVIILSNSSEGLREARGVIEPVLSRIEPQEK